MVVKEDRGRKRYILFSHSEHNSEREIQDFIKNEIWILGGKIKSKLVKFDLENGVIRVDHTLLTKVRDIINKNKSLKIKTIRTSGTLKSLEK